MAPPLTLKRLNYLIIPILVSIGWVSYSLSYRYLLEAELTVLNNQLNIFTSDLESKIEKYSFLPRVLSHNRKLSATLVDAQHDGEAINALNRDLAYINGVSNTEVIYLMRPDGTTIAASNWEANDSFIGGNFRFRPYFKNAMAGREGRYFALGTTSGRRGYYFSAPIMGEASATPLGVIVVKANIDRIEQAWQSYQNTFLVTDDHGIVFASNKPIWRFRAVKPLSNQVLDNIRQNQQYPLDILRQTRLVRNEKTPELVSAELAHKTEHYLSVQKPIATLGWNIHALATPSGLKNTALGYSAIAILVCLLSWGLIHLSSLQRTGLREKLKLKQESERQLQEAHNKLEQRVAQRTQALSKNNQILKQEIRDRRRAENKLRRTQKELIHAAKLATLGQLASGITHELNQPLAAISNYAENAGLFLSREKYSQTGHNLTEILRLTERMTNITGQLKAFAHKTDDQLTRIDMNKCIYDALALIRPKLKDSATQLSLQLIGEAYVIANSIRLEQVFINLFNNALDAMEASESRRITVTQTLEGDWIVTRLIDTGPGIAQSALENIFDAFYTTKPVGEGLGLGLSISSDIIQKMGGRLRAANHPGAGAKFEIYLKQAPDKTDPPQ